MAESRCLFTSLVPGLGNITSKAAKFKVTQHMFQRCCQVRCCRRLHVGLGWAKLSEAGQGFDWVCVCFHFPQRSTEQLRKVPTIILSITYKGVKFIDAANKVGATVFEKF